MSNHCGGNGAWQALRETLSAIKQDEKLEENITIYPAYGYRDPHDAGAWIVPMRVWVHQPCMIPAIDKFLKRCAVAYFEKDAGGALSDDQRFRLRERLADFIEDDQSFETVEFRFVDDPNGNVFELHGRTTLNGVIQDDVRIPGAVLESLQGAHPDRHWWRIDAVTGDRGGRGAGVVRFLEPEGLSIISDIDDTIKVTGVPAGKKTVLRNTFLSEFGAAEGMLAKFESFITAADVPDCVSFHYVSGSPWQLYAPLSEFLIENGGFPAGTFHMKDLPINVLERDAISRIGAFIVGGDMATLRQKVKQIATLMLHFPKRKFILVGDSGEKDPEVFRLIRQKFPTQVQEVYIRDVLGGRLAGMERIIPEAFVALDVAEFQEELELQIEDFHGATSGG